eukprot:NODE_22183_length_719_cov_1.993243.p1 GENE.NODE_22183_length_719_cov_1.993243~~NODE_22183_length_719_cov_1.993243.p1  ORF type:complete len:211 (+),score=47.18 NODE_22183_length_719_cov_1.993243:41-634(+)
MSAAAIFIFGFFFVTLILQMLEMGTALILELLFYWHSDDIGFVLGAFLAAAQLPLALAYAWIRHPCSAEAMRRSTTCAVMMTAVTMVLLTNPSAWGVLIADAFVFGTLLGSGSFWTAGYRNIAVDGSKFSTANLKFVQLITVCIARSVAGPLSRGLIDHGGMFIFGVGQFSFSVIATCAGSAFNSAVDNIKSLEQKK